MKDTTLHEIDLIDSKGNIREHLMEGTLLDTAGKRTLCGVRIGLNQQALGNAKCGRCLRILAQRGSRRS